MSALAAIVASVPASLDAAARTRLAVIANALETSGAQLVLSADHAPTVAERAIFAMRRAALADAMRPAGKEAALERYDELISVLSTRGGDRTEVLMRAVGYVKYWAALPLFALTMACNDFAEGRSGDGKWLPAPGEVCLRAKVYWQPVEREHAQLGRILAARVLPSVDRGTAEARRAAVARILAATRGGAAPTPSPPPAQAIKLAEVTPVSAAATPIAASSTLASSPVFTRAGAAGRRAPAARRRKASGRKAEAP